MMFESRASQRGLSVVLAGWFTATLVSQHPHRVFDRLRQFDRIGAIPNWRFFAPLPAQHDYVVLYRTVGEDGEVSPWRRPEEGRTHRWSAAVWSPGRRHTKAALMVCGQISGMLSTAGGEQVRRTAQYRVLRAYIRQEVLTRARGRERPLASFQFLVAKSGGHDHRVRPRFLFASPVIPLKDEAK